MASMSSSWSWTVPTASPSSIATKPAAKAVLSRQSRSASRSQRAWSALERKAPHSLQAMSTTSATSSGWAERLSTTIIAGHSHVAPRAANCDRRLARYLQTALHQRYQLVRLEGLADVGIKVADARGKAQGAV